MFHYELKSIINSESDRTYTILVPDSPEKHQIINLGPDTPIPESPIPAIIIRYLIFFQTHDVLIYVSRKERRGAQIKCSLSSII